MLFKGRLDSCDTPENHELIDCIQTNNDHLLRIVDGMLYYAQLEAQLVDYVFEYIDIKSVSETLIQTYLPKTPSTIQLEFDQSLPSILVYTDRQKLLQALSYLMDNALKFTDEGSITLAYRTIDNNTLQLSVRDTGIGIKEADRDKLFFPFYKADSFRQGVGLGLSICRWITKSLGGNIQVVPVTGKGTEFQIELPINGINTSMDSEKDKA